MHAGAALAAGDRDADDGHGVAADVDRGGDRGDHLVAGEHTAVTVGDDVGVRRDGQRHHGDGSGDDQDLLQHEGSSRFRGAGPRVHVRERPGSANWGLAERDHSVTMGKRYRKFTTLSSHTMTVRVRHES
ncbi:hypothetical protein ACFQ0B_12850 [Nonomuraea thailandensis]